MALLTDVVLLDLLGILTALVAVGYAYFKWSYQHWKRRNVPFIEPTIPFGTFDGPFKRTTNFGDQLKKSYEEAKAKGWKHCGLYSLASPIYLPIDLDLMKCIMAKDFQHFVDRGMYANEKDDPISNHLGNLSGQRWRNLRMKLTPIFTSGKLKAMFQTLVDCGVVFEKYFEESVENRTAVDVNDVLGRFTTDVIGSCAFGIDCNSFKNPSSPFRVYSKKAVERTILDEVRFLFASNYPNLSRALGLRRVPKDVSDFFTKVVEDTVAYREKNNVVRNDYLQLLINIKNSKEAQENGYKGDGNTLSLPEVVAQSFVFFIAGFETSSTTMTFALFELATHPEIQDKVREEIKTVLAKHDNQLTYDAVSELKYLSQVVDETLRLHPPAPFTARRCVEDYKIPGEDVIIEEGTRVLIPILPIHHDEEYYKNSEIFDPERFSEENKKRRHPYAHIPFGEGPRICIGERFALIQIKVGLISAMKNFKVTLNEKTKLPLQMSGKSVLSRAKGGIWLNFEKL